MLGEIVPKTSSGKISMCASAAVDATALASLAGLASRSAVAPNALLRMNSRRLIIFAPGRGISRAGKLFACQLFSGFLGRDKNWIDGRTSHGSLGITPKANDCPDLYFCRTSKFSKAAPPARGACDDQYTRPSFTLTRSCGSISAAEPLQYCVNLGRR